MTSLGFLLLPVCDVRLPMIEFCRQRCTLVTVVDPAAVWTEAHEPHSSYRSQNGIFDPRFPVLVPQSPVAGVPRVPSFLSDKSPGDHGYDDGEKKEAHPRDRTEVTSWL
jgi:hypothetical protein